MVNRKLVPQAVDELSCRYRDAKRLCRWYRKVAQSEWSALRRESRWLHANKSRFPLSTHKVIDQWYTSIGTSKHHLHEFQAHRNGLLQVQDDIDKFSDPAKQGLGKTFEQVCGDIARASDGMRDCVRELREARADFERHDLRAFVPPRDAGE